MTPWEAALFHSPSTARMVVIMFTAVLLSHLNPARLKKSDAYTCMANLKKFEMMIVISSRRHRR